jgi:membrane protein
MTLTPFLFLLPVLFHSYLGNLFTTSSIFLITILFYLMYVYFPARRVSKKEGIIGAFFSTILWVFTSYLYGLYVKYAVSLSKIYGSLIAFPLFLIWIFINWLVFLIGAELVVLLEQKNWKSPIDYIPPVWLKLYLLFIIGKAFKNEQVLNLNQISKILNLPPAILEPPLEELEKEGFVSLAEGNTFLIKPPEKIKISSLLKLGFSEKIQIPELTPLFEKIKKYTAPFSEITLEDLLN